MVKKDTVAPVVERIDHEAQAFVLGHAAGIPSHFVDDHSLRMALPAATRDVDVVVVEQNPDLRLLGRRRAFEGFTLDEVRCREHVAVDRFIELAVESQWDR